MTTLLHPTNRLARLLLSLFLLVLPWGVAWADTNGDGNSKDSPYEIDLNSLSTQDGFYKYKSGSGGNGGTLTLTKAGGYYTLKGSPEDLTVKTGESDTPISCTLLIDGACSFKDLSISGNDTEQKAVAIQSATDGSTLALEWLGVGSNTTVTLAVPMTVTSTRDYGVSLGDASYLTVNSPLMIQAQGTGICGHSFSPYTVSVGGDDGMICIASKQLGVNIEDVTLGYATIPTMITWQEKASSSNGTFTIKGNGETYAEIPMAEGMRFYTCNVSSDAKYTVGSLATVYTAGEAGSMTYYYRTTSAYTSTIRYTVKQVDAANAADETDKDIIYTLIPDFAPAEYLTNLGLTTINTVYDTETARQLTLTSDGQYEFRDINPQTNNIYPFYFTPTFAKTVNGQVEIDLAATPATTTDDTPVFPGDGYKLTKDNNSTTIDMLSRTSPLKGMTLKNGDNSKTYEKAVTVNVPTGKEAGLTLSDGLKITYTDGSRRALTVTGGGTLNLAVGSPASGNGLGTATIANNSGYPCLLIDGATCHVSEANVLKLIGGVSGSGSPTYTGLMNFHWFEGNLATKATITLSRAGSDNTVSFTSPDKIRSGFGIATNPAAGPVTVKVNGIIQADEDNVRAFNYEDNGVRNRIDFDDLKDYAPDGKKDSPYEINLSLLPGDLGKTAPANGFKINGATSITLTANGGTAEAPVYYKITGAFTFRDTPNDYYYSLTNYEESAVAADHIHLLIDGTENPIRFVNMALGGDVTLEPVAEGHTLGISPNTDKAPALDLKGDAATNVTIASGLTVKVNGYRYVSCAVDLGSGSNLTCNGNFYCYNSNTNKGNLVQLAPDARLEGTNDGLLQWVYSSSYKDTQAPNGDQTLTRVDASGTYTIPSLGKSFSFATLVPAAGTYTLKNDKGVVLPGIRKSEKANSNLREYAPVGIDLKPSTEAESFYLLAYDLARDKGTSYMGTIDVDMCAGLMNSSGETYMGGVELSGSTQLPFIGPVSIEGANDEHGEMLPALTVDGLIALISIANPATGAPGLVTLRSHSADDIALRVKEGSVVFDIVGYLGNIHYTNKTGVFRIYGKTEVEERGEVAYLSQFTWDKAPTSDFTISDGTTAATFACGEGNTYTTFSTNLAGKSILTSSPSPAVTIRYKGKLSGCDDPDANGKYYADFMSDDFYQYSDLTAYAVQPGEDNLTLTLPGSDYEDIEAVGNPEGKAGFIVEVQDRSALTLDGFNGTLRLLAGTTQADRSPVALTLRGDNTFEAIEVGEGMEPDLSREDITFPGTLDAGESNTIVAKASITGPLSLADGAGFSADSVLKAASLDATVTRTLSQSWNVLGSPIDATVDASAEGDALVFRGGFTSSADQAWSDMPATSGQVALAAGQGCIFAFDEAEGPASRSLTLSGQGADGVTIPVPVALDLADALADGEFRLMANPNLSTLTLGGIYTLSADGSRFELQENPVEVKPFTAFITANEVTRRSLRSIGVGGSGTVTGNQPALPDGSFRVWGSRGEMHLSASRLSAVKIVNLSGVVVREFNLEGERVETLPAGNVYLVICENVTYKVIL